MSWLGQSLGALLVAVLTSIVLLLLAGLILWRAATGGGTQAHTWAIRGIWIAAVTLLAVGLNLLSQTWTRAEPVTEPTAAQVVTVQASMWRFVLDPPELPLGVSIEFRLQSRDTIHGFGVYDPQGRFLFTMMAVPGHEERTVFTFTQPGNYTVRCTEYCGAPHGLMRASFVVKGG